MLSITQPQLGAPHVFHPHPSKHYINERTKAQLLTLKKSEELSITEIIRNAVELYHFLKEEQEAGRTVETVGAGGKARKEIVFL